MAGKDQDIAAHSAAKVLYEGRVEGRILPGEIHFANDRTARGGIILLAGSEDWGKAGEQDEKSGRTNEVHYGNSKQLRYHPSSAAPWIHPAENAPNNQLTPPRLIGSFRALSAPMKTFSAKANEVPRKWWIIDAKDQVLGRVAVKAANLLRGKEKAIYTTHVDTGDFVVVINAEKVRLTGKKEDQKSFMSFSGFVGGHKTENAKARRARHPELLVERAIRGMIPHNKLGRAVYRKLKVYKGDLHPHAAQQPAAVSF